jgi:hemophore-related protein
MKRLPIIAGAAGAAVLAATLLAVPAIADNGSSSTSSSTSTTAPLTTRQKAAIDSFLADHPLLAHALADRAAAWAGFLTAHPDIATEIAKVMALPVDQRRAEIRGWFAQHPEARKAIVAWRSDLRAQRQSRRQDRRGQRQGVPRGTGAATTTSLSV